MERTLLLSRVHQIQHRVWVLQLASQVQLVLQLVRAVSVCNLVLRHPEEIREALEQLLVRDVFIRELSAHVFQVPVLLLDVSELILQLLVPHDLLARLSFLGLSVGALAVVPRVFGAYEPKEVPFWNVQVLCFNSFRLLLLLSIDSPLLLLFYQSTFLVIVAIIHHLHTIAFAILVEVFVVTLIFKVDIELLSTLNS